LAANSTPRRHDGFRTGGVLTISIGHAIHDTYTAFLAPLLPLFINRLLLTKAEAGLLSVFVQGPSLLQPFIGHLADRISLRYVVILSPALTAAMMSLLVTSQTYAQLALLLIIAGASAACLHAVGPVIAGHLSGRSLGRGMGFWMVGGELGRTMGPIVIVSALALLAPEKTPLLMIGGFAVSAVLYRHLRNVQSHTADADRRLPWRRAIGEMRPLLLPLAGIIVVRAFMLSALTIYLPTFLTEEGASLWFAGISLSVLEIAGMAGALLGGSISDRLGRRLVLLGSMLIAPILMVAFLALDGWPRFPLLLLLGFTVLSVTPAIMALVQESFPESRALANGVYMSMSFGLRSVVVVALGAVGDLLGLRLAFAGSALVMLLGLPLILLLPKKQAT
jgi:FSR family fosmidomycin resistance protein-like MFS transporter